MAKSAPFISLLSTGALRENNNAATGFDVAQHLENATRVGALLVNRQRVAQGHGPFHEPVVKQSFASQKVNGILKNGCQQGRVQKTLVVAYIDAGGAIVYQFVAVNQFNAEECSAEPFKNGMGQKVNRIHG